MNKSTGREDQRAEGGEGPFDPGELVRWAETYGHPEMWAQKAKAAWAEVEGLRARIDKPTPERIERVAKAICEATSVVDYYVRGGLLWDDLKEDERDFYRVQARAALDAARQPEGEEHV